MPVWHTGHLFHGVGKFYEKQLKVSSLSASIRHAYRHLFISKKSLHQHISKLWQTMLANNAMVLYLIYWTRMWANAQRDGRPDEYRWRPLFNAAKFGSRPLLVLCSNAAKMWNPIKFTGVPQTRQQISAVSRPKFTMLWGRVEEVSVFNKFFPIVDTCLSCEDTAGQSCAMVPKWWFLRPVFSASRVQHISDMHSIFTLRPQHVWMYCRHPISDRWD